MCKDCKGSAFCAHGKQKSVCVDCGGAGICPHQKRRAECRECHGSAFCEHDKIRRTCQTCDPLGYLAGRLRDAARKAITRGGDVKDRPTLDLYGAQTFQELKDFLQLKMDHHNRLSPSNQISFDNYALDHI